MNRATISCRHACRTRPVSRVEPLVDPNPGSRSDHRRHPAGADPRRVRRASFVRSGSPGSGPGSISRPNGACPSRPWPSPFLSTWPGRISPRCTPSGWDTSRVSTGPTSCATCGTRWGTSSTTPTGCTTRRSGSSSSARSPSRTSRSTGRSRSAGATSAICRAGTPRSTRMRTGRRPLPCG